MNIKTEILNKRISNIVGSENLVTDTNILMKYSKDQSLIPPTMPLCVVRPQSVDEVQQIARLANHHKIPITPYSSGTDNQGAAIPSHGGIIVDLTQMNKIVNIDEVNRIAVIEPGVTFAQLQKEAKKYGLRVMTPVELPSSSSVLVCYLELIPLYSWPKYGTENLLTMEIVLPTGELLKTGSAAMPTLKKPYSHVGFIPYSILSSIWFGAQGTLGIVTKGVVKLKTLYEANEVFFIPFTNVEDGFELIRRIKWIRIGEEFFLMNNVDLALLLAEKLPQDFMELRKVLPQWTLILILRGDKDEVLYQQSDLEDLASKFEIKLEVELNGVKNAREKILKEIEYPKGYEKTSKYKGSRNTIPFIAPIKRIPAYNDAVCELAEKHGYPREDIGNLLLPVEVARVHYQYSFHRDPSDEKRKELFTSMFYEMSERLVEIGAFFSRPYGAWARILYDRAPAYHEFIRKFKRMIDPNNIMNPGKLYL